MNRDFTPGFNYFAFCCLQHGCRTNPFRVGRVFVSRMFVVSAWLYGIRYSFEGFWA